MRRAHDMLPDKAANQETAQELRNSFNRTGNAQMDEQVGNAVAQEGLDPQTCGRAGDQSEYVPAIFARSARHAESFKEALEECGIPTLVEMRGGDESPLSTLTRRVPVLVPAEMLEDASEVLARIEQQFRDGLDGDDDPEEDEDDEHDDFDEDDDEDDDEDEDDDDL